MSLSILSPLPDQTKRLRDLETEIRQLREQLEDKEDELRRERRKTATMEQGIARLREALTPVYSGLQMIFGEIEATGVSSTGSTAGSPDSRVTAVWESWKRRFGEGPAKVYRRTVASPRDEYAAVGDCDRLPSDIDSSLHPQTQQGWSAQQERRQVQPQRTLDSKFWSERMSDKRTPLLISFGCNLFPYGLGANFTQRTSHSTFNENLSDVFRLGTLGYGANTSRQFPWPQYQVSMLHNWCIPRVAWSLE